ncbi:MAG TPA: hypothetical protein VFO25_00125 [Candidatus Eremiobacteraceae bacterium]|nr:hypothetical protein [Candidatus Eremiobacteraceae bacterium]
MDELVVDRDAGIKGTSRAQNCSPGRVSATRGVRLPYRTAYAPYWELRTVTVTEYYQVPILSDEGG